MVLGVSLPTLKIWFRSGEKIFPPFAEMAAEPPEPNSAQGPPSSNLMAEMDFWAKLHTGHVPQPYCTTNGSRSIFPDLKTG